MLSNSRGLALFLGLAFSLVASLAFLLLHNDLKSSGIFFFITSPIASILAYGFLEILVFRKARRLRDIVAGIRDGKALADQNAAPMDLDALTDLYDEVVSLNDKKQDEIERLKKLEAFRRDFIANVSHELKTPIFAAQGFLHTLLDGAMNDKSVRLKFLRKAAKSIDGLDALVHDLLVLSHIETGQIKMQFESFDMYQLTEEVFEQFDDKLARKNINLRIESTHNQAMVYGDAQRIMQVMNNLISNAIRHSYDDGDVIVHLQPAGKYLIISVKDSGEGIPADHQPRIFERFYRVDKSRTKDKGKGGTGLGLAIVKHILEGHNSKAELESSPGRGSVFSFKLPRFKPETEN
jgi:two-component system, OmpR family, phosphate regulon sensor histidine kinase PhoR